MQGCISRLFMGCFRRPVQSESSHLNLQDISDEENVTVTEDTIKPVESNVSKPSLDQVLEKDRRIVDQLMKDMICHVEQEFSNQNDVEAKSNVTINEMNEDPSYSSQSLSSLHINRQSVTGNTQNENFYKTALLKETIKYHEEELEKINNEIEQIKNETNETRNKQTIFNQTNLENFVKHPTRKNKAVQNYNGFLGPYQLSKYHEVQCMVDQLREKYNNIDLNMLSKEEKIGVCDFLIENDLVIGPEKLWDLYERMYDSIKISASR